MFGILAPCTARTPEELRPRWMGHFCGLCLELRDDAGQAARLTTNYDALTLSVLVEAQGEPGAQGRDAGPCALRGLRRQRVTTGAGPRLAATASLLLASAKLGDHIADGDGLAARRGVAGLAGRAADRYRAKAGSLGEAIGLPVDRIAASIDRQRAVEDACGPGGSLESVTAPTAEATGELFAHAALVAERPGNIGPFRAAGAAFGTLAHLLDAAEDYEDDERRGAWNPLRATGTTVEEAHRRAHRVLDDMKAALEAASFVDTAMVALLLDRYARHAVSKVFGSHGDGPNRWPRTDPRRPGDPEHPVRGDEQYDWKPGLQRRGFWAGLCAFTVLCCTCTMCCAESYEGPWSRKPREGCCRDCCGECCCRGCCEGCGDGCSCDCS